MQSAKVQMKRLMAYGLSALLVVAIAASGFAQAGMQPAHLTQAQALVGDLQVSGINSYGSPSSIVWNGTNSEARTVCSSFLTLLFQRSYNWTPSHFSTWMGSTSPTASQYHDAIVANNGFTRLFLRNQLQPGDVIAIEYPEGSNPTGHVMLVAGAPVVWQPNPNKTPQPAIAGTTQYAIPVIDSSSSYHGPTDTRYNADGGHGNGIGQGVFRVYVDAADQIVGHTWSTYSNSQYYSQNDRHLVVGRLQQ